MSRVAKEILDWGGVNLSYDSTTMIITVNGKYGSETIRLFPGMNFHEEANKVWITLNEDIDTSDRKIIYGDKAKWGLCVRLLKNAIHGVKNLFVESLQFVGIGYKGQVIGNTLVMKVGYSHDIILQIPEGIAVKMESQTVMQLTGANKQRLGSFISIICRQRKYNPYKGKGVRYSDELVRRKPGKAAKSASA